MRIVLIGPPGAGKGTQAQYLVQHLSVPHLSTGELIRDAVRLGTPLGLAVGETVSKGNLAPDDQILDLLRDRLAQDDCAGGYLLDGVPRTVAQAEAIDELLAASDTAIDLVLEIQVPLPVLTARLLERYESASDPRPEDRPDRVPVRFEIYESQTRPVIDYYHKRGLHRAVDGSGSPSQVFDRIKQLIGQH